MLRGGSKEHSSNMGYFSAFISFHQGRAPCYFLSKEYEEIKQCGVRLPTGSWAVSSGVSFLNAKQLHDRDIPFAIPHVNDYTN